MLRRLRTYGRFDIEDHDLAWLLPISQVLDEVVCSYEVLLLRVVHVLEYLRLL